MAAVLLLAASLVVAARRSISPVDALADQLFLVHMVQHMLLLDIAPILGDPRAHEGDPAPGHARRRTTWSAAPGRSRTPPSPSRCTSA